MNRRNAALAAALLTTLASVPAIGQVPTQGEFAAQVTGACGAAPQPYDVAALLRRDRTISRRAQSDSLDRPTTWELACIRARLATTDVPARESYLMPLGSPWRHGVSMLAARLLDDSVEPRVAELLAAVNSDPVLAEPTAWTLGYLERAIRAGGGAPLVLRQCSLLAWRLSDQARVRGCATAGLSSGQDSTFHLLALARLAAMAADTAASVADFVAAAQAVGDSADRADLYWHLRWFLSPAEDSTFGRLPSSDLTPWLRERLLVRDVRDGRAAGARVVEHFTRLGYVETNFRMLVLPINRPRILTGAAIPDALGGEFSVEHTTPGSGTPAPRFRELDRWQSEFDDRGVVWMRLGPPEKRWHFVPLRDAGILNFIHRETWRYAIDGQMLLLSFESEIGDGTQDATRLVTGVVGTHFCGLDIGRCVTADRVDFARAWNSMFASKPADHRGLSVEERIDLQRRDLEAIVTATTNDDNSPRTQNHLALHAQFLRLWDPTTGRPFALVPWAIRARDLIAASGEPTHDPLLKLVVRTVAVTTDARHDTTFVGPLALPDDPAADAYVTGVNAMAAPGGATAWSVFAYLGADASGRVFDTNAQPLATGTLRLSDLVVGLRGAGTVWHGVPGGIATAPLGTVSRTDPAELYYQVDNRSATDQITTTLALYRIDPDDSVPALRLVFDDRLPRGITAVRRELSFEHLAAGTYRLAVRVSQAGGLHPAERATVINIR